MNLLNKIQQELKAPKNQKNDFGNYYYRSCEDILEAVKPLLGKGTLTLSDEVTNVGEFNYVKATATLKDGEDLVSATAYARESSSKKGMDDSQMTGTASSYARKYALNGLFAIDDTKDADTQDNRVVAKPVAKKEVMQDIHDEDFDSLLKIGEPVHKPLNTDSKYILSKDPRKVLKNNPKCGVQHSTLGVRNVTKEGDNFGRPYISCDSCRKEGRKENAFMWAD